MVRTLQQQGFYPKNLESDSGCINDQVKSAINKFLNSLKGKPVEVVVNAFRTISVPFAVSVNKTDRITQEVRIGVEAFLGRNCSNKEKAA